MVLSPGCVVNRFGYIPHGKMHNGVFSLFPFGLQRSIFAEFIIIAGCLMPETRYIVEVHNEHMNCWTRYSSPKNESTADAHFKVNVQAGRKCRVTHEGKIIMEG
jgi:hypothetical protein